MANPTVCYECHSGGEVFMCEWCVEHFCDEHIHDVEDGQACYDCIEWGEDEDTDDDDYQPELAPD